MEHGIVSRPFLLPSMPFMARVRDSAILIKGSENASGLSDCWPPAANRPVGRQGSDAAKTRKKGLTDPFLFRRSSPARLEGIDTRKDTMPPSSPSPLLCLDRPCRPSLGLLQAAARPRSAAGSRGANCDVTKDHPSRGRSTAAAGSAPRTGMSSKV